MSRISRIAYALLLPLLLIAGFYYLPAAHAGPSPNGEPRTWHVLIGAQSEDLAIQADAYYPHVITIDVGDTVVWTLNAAEPHTVTFFGTCVDPSGSCFQPQLLQCLSSGALDFIPCTLPTYDGIGLASSGRMIPSGYNWDNAIPHGNTTYSLTFTNPGVDIYFDVSAVGMRGIVIVNPAGTPYPFSQEQYTAQAQREIRSDLDAGTDTLESFQETAPTPGPGGTLIHHVAAGLSTPQATKTRLDPSQRSYVTGTASLTGVPEGLNANITATVNLTGLIPGHTYSANILLGVCGNPAPTAALFGALDTFTLNNIAAGADGRGTSTTFLTSMRSPHGAPEVLRIPSTGWFIEIADVSSAKSVESACGNVHFHNVSVMRYLPGTLHVNVGDTVVWTVSPNGAHSVTFLAGQPLPLIPDYVFTTPTGNATSYNGQSFFDSGTLRVGATFVLTFTSPGVFPYVDVLLSIARMKGTIIVEPQSEPNSS